MSVADPPSSIAILAVGGSDAAPSNRGFDDVVSYFRTVSNGCWQPAPVAVGAVTLDHRIARYTSAGGLASLGVNSRDLVAEAIKQATPAQRAAIGATGGRLVLTVPDGFRPHMWHPYKGGAPLGRRQWCQSYAVFPATAPLGTVAHELGHLLLDWPEGHRSAGKYCLMATGGLNGAGDAPAPPAGPLLVDLGWRGIQQIAKTLKLQDLLGRPDVLGSLHHFDHHILVEPRQDKMLVWNHIGKAPILLHVLPIDGRTTDQVLGCIAPVLRRLAVLARAKVGALSG